jgi:transposase IS116/IS110/IS902 family protein
MSGWRPGHPGGGRRRGIRSGGPGLAPGHRRPRRGRGGAGGDAGPRAPPDAYPRPPGPHHAAGPAGRRGRGRDRRRAGRHPGRLGRRRHRGGRRRGRTPRSCRRWPGSRRSPGVSPKLAMAVTAEAGPDMTRFPAAAHLASRAGLAPPPRDSPAPAPQTRQRARQRLPQGLLHPGRHRCRRHGHLPRRTAPPPVPPHRRHPGQMRRRPVHPGDHLAPARRPRRPVRRPRPGRHDRKTGRDRKIRAHLRQLQALGLHAQITEAAR